MMNRKRLQLLISGEVQGVGFRASAYQYAMRLGVTGWVRNLADGRVEIVAEGEQQQLALFTEWSRNGPSYAKVSDVIVEYLIATNDFKEFTIQ